MRATNLAMCLSHQGFVALKVVIAYITTLNQCEEQSWPKLNAFQTHCARNLRTLETNKAHTQEPCSRKLDTVPACQLTARPKLALDKGPVSCGCHFDLSIEVLAWQGLLLGSKVFGSTLWMKGMPLC